eukprot:scaffold48_cov311-Pinguiococcus_pyrenoidosus.AAC.74
MKFNGFPAGQMDIGGRGLVPLVERAVEWRSKLVTLKGGCDERLNAGWKRSAGRAACRIS